MATDPFAGLSPEERQTLGIDADGNIKPPQAAPGAPAAAPTAQAPGTTPAAAPSDSIGEAIKGSTFRGFADVAGGIPARLGITPQAGTGWLANTPEEQAAMAQHPWIAGAGRLVGQIGSTLPVILGAEALAPAFGAGALAARLPFGRAIGAGAIGGAEQNLLTSGEDPNENLLRRGMLGGVAGGVLGPIAGKVGQWFGGDQALASGAVQDAARTAQSHGIDVTAANLPRAGATAVQQGALATPEQAQQVTQAFGKVLEPQNPIPDVSPQHLDPLLNRLGTDVATTASRGQINGSTLLQPLIDVETNYPGIPRVKNLITSVLNEIDPATGQIPGARFQQLIRKGSPLDLAAHSTNSDISDPASDIERALHDGFMQSSQPGVAEAYSLARGKYKLGMGLQENARAAGLDTVNPATIYGTLAQKRWFGSDIARMGSGSTTPVGQMTDDMANLARSSDRLFGGTGAGAPAAAAPSAIGRGLGFAAGAGGAGAVYKAFTDPASTGAVLTWLAHNPVAWGPLLAAGGAKALQAYGQHYQTTPAFVNRLIQRGTQPATSNLLTRIAPLAGTAMLPAPAPNQQ